MTCQHIPAITTGRWLLVTSHPLIGLRLHFHYWLSRPDCQSLKGVTTFHLYGHSIFRFVLSTGVLLKVCVGGVKKPLLFPMLFWVQRINLFRYLILTMVQDGHSVSLIMDGWQWSNFFGNRFSLTPSVPRFSPRVVIPEIGGGYRRYPDFIALLIHLWASYKEFVWVSSFWPGVPCLIWYISIPNVGTYKQLWGWSGVRSLYSIKGLKSPPGGYFRYFNPISCLNVSHLEHLSKRLAYPQFDSIKLLLYERT